VLRLAGLCTIGDTSITSRARSRTSTRRTDGSCTRSKTRRSTRGSSSIARRELAEQQHQLLPKGELVCALLDLEIRARTQGRASLDDALGALWKRFGERNEAVPEGAMQEVLESATGAKVGDLLDVWVRSPGEIDYAPTLAHVGLAIDRSSRNDGPTAALGMRLRSDGGRAVVASVSREARRNVQRSIRETRSWRSPDAAVEGTNVEAALSRAQPGETVDVLVARDGRTLVRSATLDPPRRDRVRVVPIDDAPEPAREAFVAWLGQKHPAWEEK